VFYEDMKKDIVSELKKIDNFLGTKLTDAQIQNVSLSDARLQTIQLSIR